MEQPQWPEEERQADMAGEKAHIAIVDDDPKVRRLLRRCFEPEGYRVTEASDGADILARIAATDVDLITLDLTLGTENGLDVARRIRATSSVPIIMISGKGDTIDRIVGLEIGADDYITKPFHVREVLARVRTVLRRKEPPSPPRAQGDPQLEAERYAVGPWILDIPRRELRTQEGTPLNLTTAEFDLLTVFVQRPNRGLSRDTLMDALKGRDWAAFDRSIDSQIARLRKKIEAEPGSPTLIKTIRGVGYSLTADVRRL